MLVAALVIGQPAPAFAYLKFGIEINGRQVPLRWSHQVQYFVSDSGVSGVSALEFQKSMISSAWKWAQRQHDADLHLRETGFAA